MLCKALYLVSFVILLALVEYPAQADSVWPGVPEIIEALESGGNCFLGTVDSIDHNPEPGHENIWIAGFSGVSWLTKAEHALSSSYRNVRFDARELSKRALWGIECLRKGEHCLVITAGDSSPIPGSELTGYLAFVMSQDLSCFSICPYKYPYPTLMYSTVLLLQEIELHERTTGFAIQLMADPIIAEPESLYFDFLLAKNDGCSPFVHVWLNDPGPPPPPVVYQDDDLQEIIYPAKALVEKKNGHVGFKCIVCENGAISELELYESPGGYGFKEVARDLIANRQYKPLYTLVTSRSFARRIQGMVHFKVDQFDPETGVYVGKHD